MLHEFRMLQKKNKNVSFKIFATAHSAKNSDKSVVHPNFGLVNKGVRPLLFTKPRISLN